MGSCYSTASKSKATGAVWVDNRIQELMSQKEKAQSEIIHPFNKILLKLPLIKMVLRRVRAAFDACDSDRSGTIEYKELTTALHNLGAECTAEEVAAIFAGADMWDNGRLTFREFLVCLALGHLLGYIPLSNEKRKAAPKPPISPSSGVQVSLIHSESRQDGTPAPEDAAPPSPTSAQVRALLSEAPVSEAALATDRPASREAASHPPLMPHNSGVLHPSRTVSRKDDAANSLAKNRRVSFTTEQALAMEGDSSAAAAVAQAAAADLHMQSRTNVRSPAVSTAEFGPPDFQDSPVEKRSPRVQLPLLDTTAVPETSASLARATSAPEPFAILSSRPGTGDVNDPNLVAWAFHLCLEAFLQLSTGGTIKKEDLRAGIRQLAMMSPPRTNSGRESRTEHFPTSKPSTPVSQQKALPTSALEFLTDERFAELDWDADGKITFREFLFAFVNWAGIDDDDDDAADGPESRVETSRSVSRA